MLKVKLFVHELELGCLTEIDKGYVFAANKVDIDKAFKMYPIEMRRYELVKSGTVLYRDVPPVFDEFLGYTHRGDLMERAGITSADSDLERIYKLAGLDMMSTIFTIKQG